MSQLREACGVFGVFQPGGENVDVAQMTYYGLFALQHRGQESCGIAVSNQGTFHSYKHTGLVSDVFTAEKLDALGTGNMAVGHVRYSTTGTDEPVNAQPIIVNHLRGSMAVAHNGNLVNAYEVREKLEKFGSIFHTTSDTEIIAYIITRECIRHPSEEIAVSRSMDQLKGAYSLAIMFPNKLIAVRDPNGFRPLCYGRTPDGAYVVASETCALDAVGAKLIRDLQPGEVVVFDDYGVRSITEHCGEARQTFCVFEFIYFARPDSVIDGHSVHRARLRAGTFLAMQHPVEADVVVGVPDSGIDAAIGYARQSGIPYGIGFIKNKYIGRTFISPTQKKRENQVRIKLNPVSATVRGKRVVLIDDSIVRGTTSARIVKLLREAGAAEVHMRISAPPFLNPCYYGTDIDSQESLIAYQHSVEEICKIIGADSLGYLSLEDAQRLAGDGHNYHFCSACFSGKYPTELPAETKKDRLDNRKPEE